MPLNRNRYQPCRSPARSCSSRSTGSIASAGTMPPTRSRWAATRTADPPFFFQKNPDNLNLTGVFPYPPASNDVHFEVEMVVALKTGGIDIPGRRGARPRLRLCGRHRHDPPRPPGEGQGAAAAVGSGQGLRSLGALLGAGSGERDRPPVAGRDLARRERRAAADRRPQPDDLEGAGDDRAPLRPVHAPARRRDLLRHASGVGAIVRGDVMHAHIDGVGDIEVRVA